MSELIGKLTKLLGDKGILLGSDVRLRDNGWGHPEPCEASAILRPKTTEEVSAALGLCNDAGHPVVPQGGMTGLVGAAIPAPGEIALSLERMSEIEEIDTATRTMTVQAGVPLQAIQQRAYEEGFLFPLDLGARGSCTIGGNVATNAGGNRVIRYGMTRDMVLGVEAVLADGTVLSSMTKVLKNNAGYDLKQLFIGSEGTLGIVTRIVLRLRQSPRSHNAAMVAVDSFDDVTRLLTIVDGGLGGNLSAFEVMWEDFYRLTTSEPAKSRPPLEYGHPFYVLVEALGSDQESDSERFESVLGEAMEQGLFEDAVVAKSRAERDTLWEIRDDIEQLDRNAPIFTFDVSLPIPDMPDYLAGIRQALGGRWDSPSMVVFGHLGDGNLHVVVGVGDASSRPDVEEIIYRPLQACGGSIAAEHGIGTEKRPYLGYSRSAAEIGVMRTLKSALDPNGILNPGKVLSADSEAMAH
ncbi:MAG: FAD-binding oxidoreductase [Acidobacteriota bacterium]|nr:FAD-binding oxidoreductase [Acidobacteriota bacterium]